MVDLPFVAISAARKKTKKFTIRWVTTYNAKEIKYKTSSGGILLNPLDVPSLSAKPRQQRLKRSLLNRSTHCRERNAYNPVCANYRTMKLFNLTFSDGKNRRFSEIQEDRDKRKVKKLVCKG